jgi:hypothetical protein
VRDSIVLICAVLASMAAGVLIAYGVCLGMFRVFQMHAAQVEVKAERVVGGAAQIVEG